MHALYIKLLPILCKCSHIDSSVYVHYQIVLATPPSPVLYTVDNVYNYGNHYCMIGLWSVICSQNDGTVSAKEGRPYETGAQITSDGMKGLLLHSTRRTLCINSHCMLLWINVASFCVSLLTRKGERLMGIFSGTVSVEGYCVSQLRHLWKLMRSNMQLTDEELSYLVMMCMRRKLEVRVWNAIIWI